MKIARLSLILSALKRRKNYPKQDLINYIKRLGSFYETEIPVSERTLSRDIKDLKHYFGINIEVNKRNGTYTLTGYQYEQSEEIEKILLEFEIFNSMKLINGLKKNVIKFDEYREVNFEYLIYLIHAIRYKYVVWFKYYSFSQNKTLSVEVEPYGLKEYASRWYLVGKILETNQMYTFALDRLKTPPQELRHFNHNQEFDINEFFKHNFGIFLAQDKQPEEIILEFTPLQGRYVKSKPLHRSQQILKDDETGLRIKLNLKITFDFIHELLSYGSAVKVIKPESLKREIISELTKALEQYKD